MEYAFSLAGLVRAGSGLLWLALGLAAVATKPTAPGGRALAWLLVAFGGRFVLVNAFGAATDTEAFLPPFALELACDVAIVVLGVVVAVRFPTPLRPDRRGELAAAGALLVVLAVASSIYAYPDLLRNSDLDFVPLAAKVADDFLTNLSFSATILAAVALAVRLRTDPPSEARALRSWSVLLLGLSLYFVYALGRFAPGPGVPRTGVMANGLVLVLWVLAATAGRAPRVARDLTLALVAAALVGMLALVLAPDLTEDVGDVGIARSVGAALVAHALFRGAVLQPARASRLLDRGAVATGALAALLIVAQVAQSFLTAEYGLLMGGVVAGAFLFAASPIQRAIESARHAERARAPSTRTPDDRSLRVYERALRASLDRGRVRPDAEEHLAHIADDLGLAHLDVLRLRSAIETELREVPP